MSDEYQPRSTERLLEILNSLGENPRSWQAEAASTIQSLRARIAELEAAQGAQHCSVCGATDGLGCGACPAPSRERMTEAEHKAIERELERHEDNAAAAESTGAFESEAYHDAIIKVLRAALRAALGQEKG